MSDFRMLEFPISVNNALLQVNVADSYTALSDQQIDFIFGHSDSPFNQFGFLKALEDSGCIGLNTGWLPKYHLIYEQDTLLGMMIMYEKHHSYGEYVFDWAWAQAYHQHGVEYYPKLLCAIPFTPVPCKKWLGSDTLSEFDVFSALQQHYRESLEYTGLHLNYPNTLEASELPPAIMVREGHQFHWFNSVPVNLVNDVSACTETLEPVVDVASKQNLINADRFADFDHYLSTMTARKRKSIKKERLQIKNLGIECVWRTGTEITKTEAHAFYTFYQLTYEIRGQQGYLNQTFFDQIFSTLSDNIRLLVCYHDQQVVATALYFVDANTLYGRYWGSDQQFDLLHFEACYYQGIAYCIEHGLTCFNPGTQGEHKISRGFKPTLTYSYHAIYLDPFEQAIKRFCLDEKAHNRLYMAECEKKLPFKKIEC
ncbi:GNAT family N-acetyltransferase [Psychrosphaera sp. I2R16]|uniref:GNAT family N-acetyltransferase n=2 Tax=unclassified Psychrosphaera TaxID=2641570 RepID=UPI001C094524|nr:GNAT family N-acetyltransferase [Psychrosphaera sp. I2R16]MBU2881076.1 GNAT family N-acetyltransferase [Psychrosphaera sp. I2R16]